MLNVIPGTGEMLERFLGQKAPNSAHVIAFERAGEIFGVAGLYLDRYRYVMFGNFGDEVRAHPRALVKGYRTLLDIARGKGVPIHALPEEDVPTSVGFLEHIGFRRTPAGHFELRV